MQGNALLGKCDLTSPLDKPSHLMHNAVGRGVRSNFSGNDHGSNFEDEQAVAIQCVQRSGAALPVCRPRDLARGLAKKDKSPVTVADFGSQALICRALAEAFPHDPVIAEEDALELKRPAERFHPRTGAPACPRSPTRKQPREPTSVSTASWSVAGSTTEAARRTSKTILDARSDRRHERVSPRREQYAVALALVVEGRVVVAGASMSESVCRIREHSRRTASIPAARSSTRRAGRGLLSSRTRLPESDDPRPMTITVSRRDQAGGRTILRVGRGWA